MRLIFAGTPEFAAAALAALLAAGHEIVLVLTQPDRRAGRGMKLAMSPVKQLALKHDLLVMQPQTLNASETQAALTTMQADAMVVAAYGLILPPAVLALPSRGCLNIHASLLPRWRGAAPIQRAILAGDAETGISIMQMDAGLDTGAVLLQRREPIDGRDTAQTLHDKLAALGASLIVEALGRIGELTPVAQKERDATYAVKISKDEAALDWTKSAQYLARAVRAYNPFPVARTTSQGDVWRIWEAEAAAGGGEPGALLHANHEGIAVACGEGVLRLRTLQKAGGKRMTAAQFLAGNPITPGSRLGD
ncbi:MAG TPA: methionyl-tRNA formyltransferase [Betaproteobacteria bacterium]|nr:methionyl-tRNA formyltransferase [Betaproteobacteria bacterium]